MTSRSSRAHGPYARSQWHACLVLQGMPGSRGAQQLLWTAATRPKPASVRQERARSGRDARAARTTRPAEPSTDDGPQGTKHSCFWVQDAATANPETEGQQLRVLACHPEAPNPSFGPHAAPPSEALGAARRSLALNRNFSRRRGVAPKPPPAPTRDSRKPSSIQRAEEGRENQRLRGARLRRRATVGGAGVHTLLR